VYTNRCSLVPRFLACGGASAEIVEAVSAPPADQAIQLRRLTLQGGLEGSMLSPCGSLPEAMARYYYTKNPEPKAVNHDSQNCSEGKKIEAKDRYRANRNRSTVDTLNLMT